MSGIGKHPTDDVQNSDDDQRDDEPRAPGFTATGPGEAQIMAYRIEQERRKRLAYETVECWRCGRQRYTYESCHHCGGSCKPLTKRRQRAESADDGGDL